MVDSKGANHLNGWQVFGGLVLAGGVLWWLAVDQAREDARKVAEDSARTSAMRQSLAAIEDQFANGVVPVAGWGEWHAASFGFDDRGRELRVRVLVPDRQARDLFSRSSEHQFVATSAACPRRGAAVYGALPTGARLVLAIGTGAGVYIDLDCNSHALPAP